jgi:predicted nucleic acid-binding protein
MAYPTHKEKGFTILPLSIIIPHVQKFHIYIETSVWSFAFAEDVPDYRADTLTFFELCKKRVFEPYVSGAVLSEIQFADVPLRKRLEELVRSVKPVMLPLLPEADGLSEAFVREKVVPPSKPEDARHVAIAMVHGLDVLVSWNFRHIVNIRREERFNAVALLEGYHHRLRIVSPKELIYYDEIS